MSVLHINHIRNDVLKYFDGIVDVSDLNSTSKCFEANKLSRALSAYAIYILTGAEPTTIAKYIIDGLDDNGIDCLFFDSDKLTMYFCQAKWSQNGKNEPSLGDVKKFTGGIRDLINFKFERFNNKLNVFQQEIESIFANPNVKYIAVLVYTGVNNLALPASREFDDLLNEINDAGDIFSVVKLNQNELHKRISQKLDFAPINETIELKNWGKINNPHVAFYGQVNGYNLAKMWEKYHENLFSKNIRNMLGNTEVNTEMRETLLKNPNLFWYYNNGITIIADSIKKSIEGGDNTDIGKFTCENISIVNGAQTVSTIGKTFANNKKEVSSSYIQCRIIEAGSISNELSSRITKTNNRQNKIENRDFISQDVQQKRIRDELLPEGYTYIIQRIDSSIKGSYTIDLQEATTALVCASGDINLIVQLKREIGKLWEDISKAPYIKIFNPSTNSLYLLHVVLIQRKIDIAINRCISKSLSDLEKAFYNFGNRIISAKVFSDLSLDDFKDSNFNIDSLSIDFEGIVKKYHDSIMKYVECVYPNSVIPVLFKNLKKCEDVFKNAS